MNLSEFTLQIVLDGLFSSLLWGSTSEGYNYWNETFYNLTHLTSSINKLSPGIMCPAKTDPKGCEETARALGSAFTWNMSPQGHDYWQERHRKLLGYATPLNIHALKSDPQDSYEDAYERAMGGIA